MVPVETHLRQRDMSYFWDFGKNLRIKFVKQITSQLEWKIWWVLEVNQKKENNYECTEIYHLLLPDTFKD